MNTLPARILSILFIAICAPLLHGLSVVGKISSRLDLILEKTTFNDTPLHEAVDYLGARAKQLSPTGERVNIILAVPADVVKKPVKLSLELSKLIDVIKATAVQAGCEAQVEPFAVVIRLKGAKPLPAIGDDISPAVKRELDRTIIPKVAFRDTTIREAIDFLQQKSKSLNPNFGGVNMVLKMDDTNVGIAANVPAVAPPAIPGLHGAPAPPAGVSGTRISMELEHVPFLELLRYVAGLANLEVRFGEFGIVIAPPNLDPK